uniref:Uncharacterized protein n=1 Tax=Anguilla anguilla TaxID=7936 RepID=A0A0E9U5C6_ANGAN
MRFVVPSTYEVFGYLGQQEVKRFFFKQQIIEY